MFKKIFISLSIVFIAFLTGYATAQSFFLNKTPETNTTGDAATGVSQDFHVMSASEFQSKNEQLQKQKNDVLDNQIKQNLSKIPPIPTPPSTPTVSKPDSNDASSPAANTDNRSTGAGKVTVPSTTPDQPTPASSDPTPATPLTAPAPNDVYTGFQNDQNKSQPKQPSGGSGNGWNIQY